MKGFICHWQVADTPFPIQGDEIVSRGISILETLWGVRYASLTTDPTQIKGALCPTLYTQQTQNICITLYNVGPTSKTLDRRCANVIQMFCFCWACSISGPLFKTYWYWVTVSFRSKRCPASSCYWAKVKTFSQTNVWLNQYIPIKIWSCLCILLMTIFKKHHVLLPGLQCHWPTHGALPTNETDVYEFQICFLITNTGKL